MNPRLDRMSDGTFVAWDADSPSEKFRSRNWREAIEALAASMENRASAHSGAPLMVPAASAQGYFGRRMDARGEDVDLRAFSHVAPYPSDPWKYLPEWAEERDRRAAVLAELLTSCRDVLVLKEAEKRLLAASDNVRRGGCFTRPPYLSE